MFLLQAFGERETHMTMEPKSRFALYARVSTEAQEADGESLEAQIKQMRVWVAALGGLVVKEYRAQESAMTGSERLSLSTLFGDASKGIFDAVMVVNLDRLSRDPGRSSAIENNFRLLSLRLFEKTTESVLHTPEGKLTRQMQSVIGEFAVNRMKWAAAASRLERARKGWPHGKELPYGRTVSNPKERRSGVAVWVLDPVTYPNVQKMYDLYIERGLTFADVGRALGMNPETVRRIMIDQAGAEWVRSFKDPAIDQHVEVRTSIPPLFTASEVAKIAARAKQNQVERAGWANRKRDYPLSQILRCANPACGWSNLSGHQTYDKKTKRSTGETVTTAYPYYVHLARNRSGHDCVKSVPAEAVEDEIFSRLGQFLKNADGLVTAIRAAMVRDPVRLRELKEEQGRLASRIREDRRRLENAVAVLVEQRGTHAEVVVRKKLDSLNKSIQDSEERLIEVGTELEMLDAPDDVEARIAQLVTLLSGLNGYAPMFWTIDAKRALLAVFFGGGKSTRFDRQGRHVKSSDRGIFIKKVTDEAGHSYWTYEAKGRIGAITGALTPIVSLMESHYSEEASSTFSHEDLVNIAQVASRTEAPEDFRVTSSGDRPRSG